MAPAEGVRLEPARLHRKQPRRVLRRHQYPSRLPRSEPAASHAVGLTAGVFALALVAASSLQIMEILIPRFPLFPWMRLGLSYIIILPFLLRYGGRAAFALLVARNLITLLYGGQPFSTFLIGTGAGAVALLSIGPLLRAAYSRDLLGITGISVCLASVFNLSQLTLVNLALIRHAGFFVQLGPILAWSLFSGVLVAALIRLSEKEIPAFLTVAPKTASATPQANPLKEGNVWIFLVGLMGMAGILLVPSASLQVTALLVLALVSRDRGKALLVAWPFLFYLAWLHLFHTSGEYLIGDWVTREGLRDFVCHAARLGNLILLGRWVSRRFPWQWTRHSQSGSTGRQSLYVQGFLLALPLLPNLFKPSLELGRIVVRKLWTGNHTDAMSPAFSAWRNLLEVPAAPSVEAKTADVHSDRNHL